MKRFWTEVATDGERGVTLDGRPMRTPGRAPLVLPTTALARAVAGEWRAVEGEIDPRAMPLTGLANAAIDRVAPAHEAFAAGLAAYGENDLLCYRAASPAELVARQAAAWDPWLAWVAARYDVHLAVTTGILHRPQPSATLRRLGEAAAALDPFRLVALSPLVTITGSLVLGLALVAHARDAATIWAAAEVDEDWQAERWGQDALAAEARAAKRRDFDAAVAFLALLDD